MNLANDNGNGETGTGRIDLAPIEKPRMPTAGMIRQVQGIQRMNRLFNAVIDADHAAIRSLQQRFTGKRAQAKLQRALAKQKKKGRKTYTP